MSSDSDLLILPPCAEHQPKVRGWLLASVGGQAVGLVPANYVKVLGKRRGLKHAEIERLAEVQQGNTAAHPQSNPAPGFTTPGLGPASALVSTEVLLEAAYRETPAPFSPGPPGSSVLPSTVLNIPEKTDL